MQTITELSNIIQSIKSNEVHQEDLIEALIAAGELLRYTELAHIANPLQEIAEKAHEQLQA